MNVLFSLIAINIFLSINEQNYLQPHFQWGVFRCCHHLSVTPPPLWSSGPRFQKEPFSCVCGQPAELWDVAVEVSSLDISEPCWSLCPALQGTLLKSQRRGIIQPVPTNVPKADAETPFTAHRGFPRKAGVWYPTHPRYFLKVAQGARGISPGVGHIHLPESISKPAGSSCCPSNSIIRTSVQTGKRGISSQPKQPGTASSGNEMETACTSAEPGHQLSWTANGVFC